MVKINTKFSFGFTLEIQKVKKTVRLLSKALRIATETIQVKERLPPGVLFFSIIIPWLYFCTSLPGKK